MPTALISTWSFSERGVQAAWPALAAGGDPLEAVLVVCDAAEADATVDSVGFGGIPDASGAVTLDACVMLGPDRTGGVCAVARHLHVGRLARVVMESTPHTLIAGEGADRLAEANGFAPRELVSDEARKRWETWKADGRVPDQSGDQGLAPDDPGDGGPLFGPESGHDTVSALALDERGQLAGACSTSGLPFKLPGRVGDSPIIGHGLYVHPKYGAAAATGEGELISGQCASFLIVELMRSGATPAEAIAATLQRLRDDVELRERDQVGLIALAPDGTCAGGALRDGFRYVVAAEGADPQVL